MKQKKYYYDYNNIPPTVPANIRKALIDFAVDNNWDEFSTFLGISQDSAPTYNHTDDTIAYIIDMDSYDYREESKSVPYSYQKALEELKREGIPIKDLWNGALVYPYTDPDWVRKPQCVSRPVTLLDIRNRAVDTAITLFQRDFDLPDTITLSLRLWLEFLSSTRSIAEIEKKCDEIMTEELVAYFLILESFLYYDVCVHTEYMSILRKARLVLMASSNQINILQEIICICDIDYPKELEKDFSIIYNSYSYYDIMDICYRYREAKKEVLKEDTIKPPKSRETKKKVLKKATIKPPKSRIIRESDATPINGDVNKWFDTICQKIEQFIISDKDCSGNYRDK